jgi:putative endonuclease
VVHAPDSPRSRAPRLEGRPASGRAAEALAAAHLESLGLQIRARNWRRDGREGGELDIVADDNGCCVFVEVRSRTGEDKGHPLESITPQKRAHVIRAARLYLEAESPSAAAYRFDVVAVTFWPDPRPPDLLHIPHAFETS